MAKLDQLKAARDIYQKLAAAADVLESYDKTEKQLQNMEARAKSLGAELDQKQAQLDEAKAAQVTAEKDMRAAQKASDELAKRLASRAATIEAECEERLKEANARALGAMTEATQAESKLRDLNRQIDDRKSQLARLVSA